MKLLSKKEEIKEIPKVQRYLSRPSIDEIFNKDTTKDKQVRNKQSIKRDRKLISQDMTPKTTSYFFYLV